MVRQVHLPRRLSDKFKRAAKLVFPREEYAILLGHVNGGGRIVIDDLYFPDDRDEHCTKDYIDVQEEWWSDAKDIANTIGTEIMGDIHSHCYTASYGPGDAAPSEIDLDYGGSVQEKCPLLGICVVNKSKTGKLISRIRFQPVSPAPKIVIT